MLGLSSALAAALATSAFGLTQNTIWQLADALDLWRLALAALGSIASPVVWLIADHELWERRSGRAARLGQPIRLYAITIVITVTLGVASLYGALLVLNFLASEIFIADEILADTLGHPAGVREYALLAWATTSAAVVGGALGAGLENDEAVRRAAYGNREAERRGQPVLQLDVAGRRRQQRAEAGRASSLTGWSSDSCRRVSITSIASATCSSSTPRWAPISARVGDRLRPMVIASRALTTCRASSLGCGRRRGCRGRRSGRPAGRPGPGRRG
jgi:hypothetical protein